MRAGEDYTGTIIRRTRRRVNGRAAAGGKRFLLTVPPSTQLITELLEFVQAMLSNLDRQLREPAVVAQAISDNGAQWVMLYQASLEFEERRELSG